MSHTIDINDGVKDNIDDTNHCYICFLQGNIVKLCNCNLYVHHKCLDEWIQTNQNPTCRICKHPYQLNKIKMHYYKKFIVITAGYLLFFVMVGLLTIFL